MSIFASILRSVYKLSGAKKVFALPEDALRKELKSRTGIVAFLRPPIAKHIMRRSQWAAFPA